MSIFRCLGPTTISLRRVAWNLSTCSSTTSGSNDDAAPPGTTDPRDQRCRRPDRACPSLGAPFAARDRDRQLSRTACAELGIPLVELAAAYGRLLGRKLRHPLNRGRRGAILCCRDPCARQGLTGNVRTRACRRGLRSGCRNRPWYRGVDLEARPPSCGPDRSHTAHDAISGNDTAIQPLVRR